jgi:hypothetical protein
MIAGYPKCGKIVAPGFMMARKGVLRSSQNLDRSLLVPVVVEREVAIFLMMSGE